eukprot:jgi/Mesen1/2932/ME001754S01928
MGNSFVESTSFMEEGHNAPLAHLMAAADVAAAVKEGKHDAHGRGGMRSAPRGKKPAGNSSAVTWAVPFLWVTGALLCLTQGFHFMKFNSQVNPMGSILKDNDIQTLQDGCIGGAQQFVQQSLADGHLSSRIAPLRIGILSTYPPQPCGIGEFASSIAKGLLGLRPVPPDVRILVIDSVDTPLPYTSEVALVIRKEEIDDYIRAADYANANFDVILCQHEFGIYGGQYGDLLFALVKRLAIPVVFSMHTLLTFHPAPYLRHLHEVLASGHVHVVMPSVCGQLADVYPGVECSHVQHGIQPLPSKQTVRERFSKLIKGRPLIVSGGLISPTKGLEHMVEGMRQVARAVPDALYLIVGQQHPGVQSAYIQGLQARVARHKLQQHVSFVSEYQEQLQLAEWFVLADVVVVPHLDLEQVSSGTLSMAMGVGAAVVSTHFRYAQHLCGDGVAGADGVAQAAVARMKEAAWRRTRSMTWAAVAAKTLDVCNRAVEAHRARSGSSNIGSGGDSGKTQGRGEMVASGGSGGGGSGDGDGDGEGSELVVAAASGDAWGRGARQALLAEGLARVRAYVDAGVRELNIAQLVPTLELPTRGRGLTHAYAARLVRALSKDGLTCARWLPARAAPAAAAGSGGGSAATTSHFWVTVDPNGRFFASNGLLVLHGDLAVGTVFHARPERGLIIGRGVLYSGSFARFLYGGVSHEVRLQEHVNDWGHDEVGRTVFLWFSSRLTSSDNTTIGTCTYTYQMTAGQQGLDVTVAFNVWPSVHVPDVEIIVGMDYMSKIHKGLVFDRFYKVPAGEDGDVAVKVAEQSSSDLFR